MKFSIKDFFSNCDHILRKLRIKLHLLKKSSMENFIFVQCHFREGWLLNYIQNLVQHILPEAVAQRYSLQNVLLQFSQNSKESTCGRVSFLRKLQACTCGIVSFFNNVAGFRPATLLKKRR